MLVGYVEFIDFIARILPLILDYLSIWAFSDLKQTLTPC